MGLTLLGGGSGGGGGDLSNYVAKSGTQTLASDSVLLSRGLFKSRANDLSGQITAKVVGDTADGLFNWVHDGDYGYLLHLTTGTNMTANALIGMGIDYGGKGLLINNKKTGIGINLTQNSTITGGAAYGFYGSTNSNLAPLMRLHQQVAGAAAAFWVTADGTATAGQKLLRWGVGSASPTDTGYIDAVSGELVVDRAKASGLKLGYVAKTAAYTLTATDHTVNVDATSGSLTMTLPTAVGIAGQVYVVRKSDSSTNTVVVDGNGSETINGQTTYTVTAQYETVTVQSDGAGWMVI